MHAPTAADVLHMTAHDAGQPGRPHAHHERVLIGNTGWRLISIAVVEPVAGHEQSPSVRLERKGDNCVAQAYLIVVDQLLPLDGHSVDTRAIGTVEVFDPELFTLTRNLGVMARDLAIFDRGR